LSTIQFVLLLLAAVVWVGGNKLLYNAYKKRKNKSSQEMASIFRFYMLDFNFGEWCIFATLLIAFLSLGFVAMVMGSI